ncbi:MAG: VCBS repeat-containing protein [Bacteroidota bacterium]
MKGIQEIRWYGGSLFLILFLLSACTQYDEASLAEDEMLAKARCGSCHLYPEPSLLPKEKWDTVLIRMGARMGVPSRYYNPYEKKSIQKVFKLKDANIYPESPTISEEEWKRINRFFKKMAPEEVPVDRVKDWHITSQFQPKFPDTGFPAEPSITMVQFDPKAKALYVADRGGNFARLNEELRPAYKTRFLKPIVDIARIDEQSLYALTIGQLYPDEGTSGAVVSFGEDQPDRQNFLFGELPRPVAFLKTDLDSDQQTDLLICSFGNDLGKFSRFEQNQGFFVETVLKGVAGSSIVYAEDLNGDGLEELIVLFAQADEGISIFYQRENGFQEKRVLRFPSIYGSNDFEFLDFDGDGHKDIILSNGDNGDKSNVLKPYHGIRIFLNDGEYNFSEKYFFPFFGSSKVRCRDFDLDGDLDVFAMSFFPDFSIEGAQALVYLENKGDWQFTPYQIEGAGDGRWMVMDAGDVDQDGDEDIVLGSFTLNSEEISPELMEKWQRESKKVLFLENQHIQ